MSLVYPQQVDVFLFNSKITYGAFGMVALSSVLDTPEIRCITFRRVGKITDDLSRVFMRTEMLVDAVWNGLRTKGGFIRESELVRNADDFDLVLMIAKTCEVPDRSNKRAPLTVVEDWPGARTECTWRVKTVPRSSLWNQGEP